MPDGEAAMPVETEQQRRHEAGAKIGQDDDPAPVEPVYPDPGKGADNGVGKPGEKAEQRQCCRAAGFLIGPDEQGKAGHARAQGRHKLSGPDKEKCLEPA